MKAELDALFFSAHPDDAELCCGGTIAAMVKAGKRVGIADLTRGELGTRGSVKLRKKEAENASKALGIHSRNNLSIPDGNIQNTPQNRLKIIKLVRELRPTLIFLPHFYDRHPDHYNTHHLVKDAAFYAGLTKIKTPGLKPYRPHRSFYYMQTYSFEPNVIFDISDTFGDKIKAIKCYSSQFYSGKKSKEPETLISSRKFFEFIEARSKYYGFMINADYGEPYFCEEKIKLNTQTVFNI